MSKEYTDQKLEQAAIRQLSWTSKFLPETEAGKAALVNKVNELKTWKETEPQKLEDLINETDAREKFLINTEKHFNETVDKVKQFVEAKKNCLTTEGLFDADTNEFYKRTYEKLSSLIKAGKEKATSSRKKALIVIGEIHGYYPKKDNEGKPRQYGDDRSLVAELMALHIAKENNISDCISETTEKINYSKLGYLEGKTRPVGGNKHLPIQAFRFADELGMKVHDACDPMHGKTEKAGSPERTDAMDEGVKSCMQKDVGREGAIMLAGGFHIKHLTENLREQYTVIPINAVFHHEDEKALNTTDKQWYVNPSDVAILGASQQDRNKYYTIVVEQQSEAKKNLPTIGIISPSSDMPGIREGGKAFLKSRGYEVNELTKLSTPEGTRLANNPYAAAAEIIKMSDEVDVLWANHGGEYASKVAELLYQYGSNPKEYLALRANNPITGEKLEYGQYAKEGFPSNPPTIVGYSDITNIQNVLGQFGFPSIYAPNLEHLENDHSFNKTMEILQNPESTSINGLEAIIPTVQPQKIEGKIQSGCLDMLAGSVGTNWQFRADESTILAIEVVRSSKTTEKHLEKLKEAGALNNVTAIVVGKTMEPVTNYSNSLKTLGIPVFQLPDGKQFGHFGSRDMHTFQPIVNFANAIIDTESGTLAMGATADKKFLEERKSKTLEKKPFQKEKSDLSPIEVKDFNVFAIEYTLNAFDVAQASVKPTEKSDIYNVVGGDKNVIKELSENQFFKDKLDIVPTTDGATIRLVQEGEKVVQNGKEVAAIGFDKWEEPFKKEYDYYNQMQQAENKIISEKTTKQRIQNLDALDLATTVPISLKLKEAAKKIGAEISIKPKLNSETRNITNKSWLEKGNLFKPGDKGHI
jgi:muramoyltetrapeptide carboxypeptidase LdcA involved in peptidoglycan recycling